MKLHSQEVRKLAPENDPLKIGMGWSVADLDKPQILVESSLGDSHPGSAHLNKLVEEAGYEVILCDTSEFRKLDGGLSCMSLRF